MPAPATVDEFIELVRKSGVVDESKLNNYLSKQSESGATPTDPSKYAGKLVRDAILTYFQAEQLLQGKWKRFTIGKYKVLEKLGVGGMGQVFLCEHKLMRRRVAVKVLPAAKGQDDASRERFYQEARAVAALDHPNIVRAYDIDHDDGLHFLVMEFVDGVNLQDLVKRSGPLDPYRACHYIYGAAVGLQYASETGIVHRDIKPGNILIDRSGVVKILDMGLARFFNDEDDSLTKKYDENVLGTADYLAPEQAVDSHSVTIRADLYSLGGTFYYLLTGMPPFPEGSVAQKLLWHQTRDPKPISQIRSEVPSEIIQIVEKLMKKDPQERYQTPGELIAALQEFVLVPIPPPNEKELPPLSPAAAGNTSTSNRATSGILLSGGNPMVSSTQSSFEVRISQSSGSTSTNSTGERPVSTVVAQASQNADVQVGVWSTLEGDTAPRDSMDTSRSNRPLSNNGSTKIATPQKSGRRKLILLAGGLLALIAASVVGYIVMKPSSPSTGVSPTASLDYSRLYVTKGPPPNPNAATYTRVLDALDAISKIKDFDEKTRKASPVIVLLDEHHEEAPFLFSGVGRYKDLTIESADPSKPVVWTVPAAASSKRVIEIRNANGLKIRGITFDAANQLDYGLLLSGSMAGASFEDIAIRGARKSLLRLENVNGDTNKPCTFSRLQMISNTDNEAAIQLTVPERSPGINKNAFIRIADSRFHGPGQTTIVIDTPIDSLEMTNNRIYNYGSGIVFRQPITPGGPCRMRIQNNTFHTINERVMGSVEHDLPANAEILFTRNYAAKVKEMINLKNIKSLPGLQTQDNATCPESGPGNMIIKPIVIADYKMPAPAPESDNSNFLKYPKTSPLWTAGPNRTFIGASPD